MMNERMGTVTVLRCAGCEAHTRRIAELEQLVLDLKQTVMRVLIEKNAMKRRVLDAVQGEME
ncbi:hypothetical protein ACVME5_006634 [Bradyrhizobium liaoningense]